MSKNLIVGWDGAPFELIEDYIHKGYLPNLKKIRDKGSYGPLETIVPTISSCAWTTAMTGMNPGKHGIFDFYRNDFIGQDYFRKPIDGTYVKEERLWDILSDSNRQVGVHGICMSYPTYKINGSMVGCMLTPDVNSKDFTYPENLLENYNNKEDYIIDIESARYLAYENPDKFIDLTHKMIDERQRLNLHLIRSNNFDDLILLFIAPDRFFHYFWQFLDSKHPYVSSLENSHVEKYRSACSDLFRKLDFCLGQLVDEFTTEGDDINTLVMSDHGFDSVHKWVHLNKWLNYNGYLVFKDKSEWDQVDNETLVSDLDYIYGKVDWSKTTAYCLGKRGAVYFNLKGRDPNGIVEKKDIPSLFENLKKDLSEKLVDDLTGQSIYESFDLSSTLFHGDNVDEAPDAFLEMKRYYFTWGYASNLDSDSIISLNNKTYSSGFMEQGIESGDGIFYMSGNNVKTDNLLTNISLKEITPTILALNDISISENMDGRIVKELFASYNFNEEIYRKVKKVARNKVDKSNEAIEERLKSLGYM